MTKPSNSSLVAAITSALGRLRFPKLFMVVGALFFVDLVIPDVIPFIDEILLAAMTLLLGNLRDPSARREQEEEPPIKNVTPPSESSS